MSVNLKITETAKTSLDTLKSDYKFNNFSDCITTIGTFFKNNNVSPRDSINNSLLDVKAEIKTEIENLKSEIKTEIKDFSNWVKDDSKTLRKWHGRWVQDYFIGTTRNVEELKNFILNGNEIKTNTFLEKAILKNEPPVNDNNDSKILKLKNEIEDYHNQLTEYSKTVDMQENIFREYKKQIKIIKSNLSYEKNTFGKTKILIDLTKEEVDNIFSTIENL